MKKYLIILLCLTLCILLAACSNDAELKEWYKDGYEQGYKDGYEEGLYSARPSHEDLYESNSRVVSVISDEVSFRINEIAWDVEDSFGMYPHDVVYLLNRIYDGGSVTYEEIGRAAESLSAYFGRIDDLPDFIENIDLP